ncbi:MAG: hypothetical protein ACYC6M_14790 [Terriglobales bacterium]
MTYGFNTDVRTGDELFHVQTEPCTRPAPAIETTIFQGGIVQFLERVPLSSPAQAEQLRAQHAAVIAQLQAGNLRGRGPALEIEAAPEAGDLTLRLRRENAAVPQCQLWVRVQEDGRAAPEVLLPVSPDGLARVRLPAGGAVICVRASSGLSRGEKTWRIWRGD